MSGQSEVSENEEDDEGEPSATPKEAKYVKILKDIYRNHPDKTVHVSTNYVGRERHLLT